ncbi:MAG TPA: peptidase S10 [Caulobacteraceae bacterium]|jgi:carboxypeptidase C (cathepsin A)|nr:peptidase S10 [Caulobacteraceae bacterium]
MWRLLIAGSCLATLFIAPAAFAQSSASPAAAEASQATGTHRTGRVQPTRAPDEPSANPPGMAASAPGEGGRADPDCDHAGPSEAQQKGADPRADRARCRKLMDWEIASAPVNEIRRVTRHTAVIGGRTIPYTATAGTLTVRDDEGKPTLSMFYVAYTAGEGRDPNRPVTFLYNGGPGSSSLWLHMGSLAPMRVETDSPKATHNAPFRMVDNNDSLLDKSDLVFIDAPGAGFSRPLGDTKLQAFWGTDPDIDAFARGVERYLTLYDRWNSPKFIFGESYGTTRSAGLAYRLQSDGAQLNGVILLSSILNYGRRDPGFDQELINYIPSYAAIAAYHGRVSPPPGDLNAFLQQARDFARGPYALALAQGQNLSDADRQAMAQQLSHFTGLPVDYLLKANLRVEPGRFREELLRDQRLILGRYDARFTGSDVDALGENPEYDPSDTGISGAFVSAFHHYLTADLGFTTDMTYRPTYYSAGIQWDFKHQPPGGRSSYSMNQADVALDLSAAMRENPSLKLYSLNGVYDLATPFFGTEYDLNHMQLPPGDRANVRFAYYPSGHMVYLNPDALHSMKADLARFYDEAAPPR